MTIYRNNLKNREFDKVGASGLQQRSGAEAGHGKTMADAGGCKDEDDGAVKNRLFRLFRYMR